MDGGGDSTCTCMQLMQSGVGAGGVCFGGPSVRYVFPDGVWLGETASPLWFSLLQTSPSLAGVYSDAGVGSVSYIGVWFFFLGNAFGVVFPGAGVVDWFSGRWSKAEDGRNWRSRRLMIFH